MFVAWFGEAPHIPETGEDDNQCVEQIMNVVTYIEQSGASLTTLRIFLVIQAASIDTSQDETQDWESSNPEKRAVDTVPGIAYSDTLRKSLAELRVAKSLDIYVDSNFEGDCEIMMAFASRIGYLKQWPIKEVQKKREENISLELDCHDPSSGLIRRAYSDEDEDGDVMIETSFTVPDEDFGEGLWRNRRSDKMAWIDHRKAGGKIASENDRYLWTWFLGNQ